MKISEIIIKIIGVVLAIVGFALLLSIVGINLFGIAVSSIWVAIILGIGFLGVGIYLIRGGGIQL